MISDMLQYKDRLAMSLKHFHMFTNLKKHICVKLLLATMFCLFCAGLFLGVSVVKSSPVISLLYYYARGGGG